MDCRWRATESTTSFSTTSPLIALGRRRRARRRSRSAACCRSWLARPVRHGRAAPPLPGRGGTRVRNCSASVGTRSSASRTVLLALCCADARRLHPHRSRGIDHHPGLARGEVAVAVGRNDARPLLAGTRRQLKGHVGHVDDDAVGLGQGEDLVGHARRKQQRKARAPPLRGDLGTQGGNAAPATSVVQASARPRPSRLGLRFNLESGLVSGLVGLRLGLGVGLGLDLGVGRLQAGGGGGRRLRRSLTRPAGGVLAISVCARVSPAPRPASAAKRQNAGACPAGGRPVASPSPSLTQRRKQGWSLTTCLPNRSANSTA